MSSRKKTVDAEAFIVLEDSNGSVQSESLVFEEKPLIQKEDKGLGTEISLVISAADGGEASANDKEYERDFWRRATELRQSLKEELVGNISEVENAMCAVEEKYNDSSARFDRLFAAFTQEKDEEKQDQLLSSK